MTEEERRFKIKKKESYESRMISTEVDSVISTMMVGTFFLIFSITTPTIVIKVDELDMVWQVFLTFLTIGSIGGLSFFLQGLISKCCKKNILESKISDIDMELEFDEQMDNQEEELVKVRKFYNIQLKSH